METFIALFVVFQCIIFIIHLIIGGALLTDNWNNDLSDYFPTRQSSTLFFIPLIGFYVFIYYAIVKRINDNYSE
jgi:hypothetical protein